MVSDAESKDFRSELDRLLSIVKKDVENRPEARKFLQYASFDPKDYIIKDLGPDAAAKTDGTKIYLNERYLHFESLTETIDTLKHEVAHRIRRRIGVSGTFGHDFGWFSILKALGGKIPEMYAACADCGQEQALYYTEHVDDLTKYGYTPCQVCKSHLYTANIDRSLSSSLLKSFDSASETICLDCRPTRFLLRSPLQRHSLIQSRYGYNTYDAIFRSAGRAARNIDMYSLSMTVYNHARHARISFTTGYDRGILNPTITGDDFIMHFYTSLRAPGEGFFYGLVHGPTVELTFFKPVSEARREQIILAIESESASARESAEESA